MAEALKGKLRHWRSRKAGGGRSKQPVTLFYGSRFAAHAPDFAAAVARGVSEGRFDRGVLVCGSGIGMAIAANKVAGVRAAAIGDVTHPAWRASSVGVYRLWRDLGYAFGAVISGVLADAMGLPTAITAVAVLTFLSGVVVAIRMKETLPGPAGMDAMHRTGNSWTCP